MSLAQNDELQKLKKCVKDAEELLKVVDSKIKEYVDIGKRDLLSSIQRHESLVKMYAEDLKKYIGSSVVDYEKAREVEKQLDQYTIFLKQDLDNMQTVIDKHNNIIKKKDELIDSGNSLLFDAKREIENFINDDNSNDIEILKNEMSHVEDLIKRLKELTDDDDLVEEEKILASAEEAIRYLLDNLRKQHPTTQHYTTSKNQLKTQLLTECDKLIQNTNDVLSKISVFFLMAQNQIDSIEDFIDVVKNDSCNQLALLGIKLLKHEDSLTNLLTHFHKQTTSTIATLIITTKSPYEKKKQELIDAADEILKNASKVLSEAKEVLISIKGELTFVQDLRFLLEKTQNDDELQIVENKLSNHSLTLKNLLSNFVF